MKPFFNVIIVIGYILFGTMWLKSLNQVVFYNSLIDIFEFKNTTTSTVNYFDHFEEDEKVVIVYEFNVGTEMYKNKITANRESFAEKVGINEIQKVFYNGLMPSVNYLENWKLDNYFNFTFALFSIFISLVVYTHIKVDRDKCISRYKKALNS